MIRVIVTDGGNGQNRSALAAVRALAAARSYEVDVTVSGRSSVSAWSRHCAGRVGVPPVQSARFGSTIAALLDATPYDAAFPASDAALVALGWPGAELVDKAEVSRRATAAGFPRAVERIFRDGTDLLDHAADLNYPLVMKVAVKKAGGSSEVRRFDGPAELAAVPPPTGPVVVQEWLDLPMRAVAGVFWDGRLRAVLHQTYLRTWPAPCGVASAAVSCEPDREVEERIVHVLAGYDGVFQAQLLGPYLVDVNPRIYGSMALALAAGLNLPDLACRLLRGEPVGDRRPLRARTGVRYRWLEGDIRHVLRAKRVGDMTWRQAAHALWPAPGTTHGDVSLADPVPTLARLRHALGTR